MLQELCNKSTKTEMNKSIIVVRAMIHKVVLFHQFLQAKVKLMTRNILLMFYFAYKKGSVKDSVTLRQIQL